MILNHLIRPVFAAPPAPTINLGIIEGTGEFQKNIGNNLIGGKSATTADRLGVFLSTIITTITVVASLAFVLYFTMAAFKWITSSGDKNQVSEAQTQMTQAAIGLIVVVVSYFIIGIVGGVLGIDVLNPAKMLGIK